MKALGLRVEPKKVHYSIIDEVNGVLSIIAHDNIAIPQALSEPEQLKAVKLHLLSIIEEFEIKSVGIKLMESNTQTISVFRCYIEGVIIETLASSSLEKYFAGNIVTLAPLFNTDRNTLKEAINGNDIFSLGDIWTRVNKIKREAIISAMASLR